jgi:saccharopine dehydrogenase-like NADP-dependent oxidoreductase
MVDLGFLSDEPIQVGDELITPINFAYDLLEPQLQYKAGERDIAAVRIDTRGLVNGERKRILYQMIDRRDLQTGFLAMQRTLGFTASIGAQMILHGDIKKRGLLMPGVDIPGDVFFHELAKRDIHIDRWELDW